MRKFGRRLWQKKFLMKKKCWKFCIADSDRKGCKMTQNYLNEWNLNSPPHSLHHKLSLTSHPPKKTSLVWNNSTKNFHLSESSWIYIQWHKKQHQNAADSKLKHQWILLNTNNGMLRMDRVKLCWTYAYATTIYMLSYTLSQMKQSKMCEFIQVSHQHHSFIHSRVVETFYTSVILFEEILHSCWSNLC